MAKRNTETLASITCLHLMKHMYFCDVIKRGGAEIFGLRSWEVSKKSEKNGFKVSEILRILKIAGFLSLDGVNNNSLKEKLIYFTGQFDWTASLYRVWNNIKNFMPNTRVISIW